MPIAPRTINVVANPFIAVDRDGIPQGVVAMPGMSSMHVGARIDVGLSAKTGKSRYYYPLDREGSPVVKIHFTPEIARSVQEGELLAADEKSARMCGVSKKILSWEDALEAEKKRALAYYTSVAGEDATLAEIPREEDADAKAAHDAKQGIEAEKPEPSDAKALTPPDKKKLAAGETPIVPGRQKQPGDVEVSPGLTLETKES